MLLRRDTSPHVGEKRLVCPLGIRKNPEKNLRGENLQDYREGLHRGDCQ